MLFSTFTSFFFALLAFTLPMVQVNARAIPLPLRDIAKRSPIPQEDINLVPAEAAVRGINGVIEVIQDKRAEPIAKRQQVNNVDLIAPSMSKNGQIVPFSNPGKRDVPKERRSRLFAGLKEPKQLGEARQVNNLGDSDATMSKNEEIIPFVNNGKRDALPEGHERRALDGAVVNTFSTSRATRSRNGVIEYI